MAKADTSPTGGVGWRNLRTGLLFIAGLVIAGILGLIIGKNTSLLSRHDTARLFVSSIKGLSEGNMVAISGKKIGVVKNMDITTRNDSTGVLVTLDINHDYFHFISTDSKATIKALGVLGDKFVDITLGSGGKKLADGEFLDVAAEPGLEELTASAIETMGTIREISGKINKGEGTIGRLITTTELNDKLLKTIANVENMTDSIVNGKGLASRIINDQTLANNAVSMLNNLTEVSALLKAGKGSLGKFIVDETFYDNVSSVSRRTDSLLATITAGKGTLGKMAADPRIYDNLNRSIMSLDSLLIDLKQNPGRYVSIKVF